MRHFAVAVAIVAMPLLTSVVRADIPPPKGYVEDCTLEIQCRAGRICGTIHGEANADCEKSAIDAGMERRCTSYGATVGSVVYCPQGAPLPAPAKVAPGSKGRTGCTITQRSSGAAVFMVAAFALCAVLVRRQRRRSARVITSLRGARSAA